MSKKANLIYKIIITITLGAPTLIYLFLSATLFNIQPEAIINNADLTQIQMITTENENSTDIFLYVNNTNVTYSGFVSYEQGHYGVNITSQDIVKIGKDYYQYNTETNQLVDIKKFAIQQHTSYTIPITVFISAVGVAIVALIITKKMEWYKKYKKLAVFVALGTGSIILFLMNMIVSNLANVFLIAWVSWSVYCLEFMVKDNILTEKQAQKTESSILSSLREALKE